MSIDLARGQITHLSYSSIATYIDCGRKWKYKYIDNRASPPSAAATFGTAFHGVVKDIIWNSTRELSVSVADLWDKQLRLAFAGFPPGLFEQTESIDDLYELGLTMLQDDSAVLRELGLIKPLLNEYGMPFIEKQLSFNVFGVPVPIIGYIDLVNADGIPYDFKTSATAWPKDRAANELQTLFYLAALEEAGYPSPDRTFRHVVFPKSGKTRIQVLEHTHTQAELDWLRESILEYWNAIRARVFTPNPSSNFCSPKYCAFWQECRGKR